MILSVAMALLIGASLAVYAGVSGVQVSLTDRITANIIVADVEGAPKSATVKFLSGDDVTKTVNDVAVILDGTSAFLLLDIAIKDISKTVLVDFNESETEYSFSVSDYLTRLAEDGTPSQISIATALIDYAEAARSYFAKESLPAVSGSIAYDTEISRTEELQGLDHHSVTLLLKSETTIRHYFKAESDIGGFTFFVDLDLDGELDAAELLYPFENGEYYCVDIKGIKPYELGKQFKLTVKDSNDTYSCTYGALNYAKNTFASGNNTAKALALALEQYSVSVDSSVAEITYALNGGEINDDIYTKAFIVGADVTLPEDMIKDGFTFAGWFKDAACTESADESAISDAGEDITLYAKWDADTSNIIYTVDGATVKTEEYISGEQSILDYIPEKTGYIFAAWCTDPALSYPITYIPEDAEGDITLYAKFTLVDLFNVDGDDMKRALNSWSGMTSSENSDGSVTYTYSNAADYVSIGENLNNALGGSYLTVNGEEIKTYKVSLKIGKVAGSSSIPLTINTANLAVVNVPEARANEDATVCLGNGASGSSNVTIATLPKDGTLVTVEFYISFAEVDLSASSRQPVTVMAYNTDGVLVTAGTKAKLDPNDKGMFRIFAPLPMYSSKITVGDIHMTPVNEDLTPILTLGAS